MSNVIEGAKGGGGATFTQKPDNLRSTDLFEGLLGLGHGPWKGLVNNLRSLKIDGTALEDASGTVNFPDWVAQFANGDPAAWPQKPKLRLGNGASPTGVNVDLSNVSGTGTAVVRSVANTNADYIDLRFIVNELYNQTKSGFGNATMTIKIRMKPTGSVTWIDILANATATEPTYSSLGSFREDGVQVLLSRSYYDGSGARVFSGTSGRLTITGKTTQAYVKEIRIAVPNTGTYAGKGWDIECTLMEIEDVSADPNFTKRKVNWESATAVYNTDLGSHTSWKGLAWLSIFGPASDRISRDPQIYGDYYTKIVSVPPTSVYNPTTRQYTGTVWDGSWIKEYTPDPGWVLADVIADPLCGISSIAPGSYLNKWDALELSKHCGVLVSDGAGGTHPRYELNVTFDQAMKADEFIKNLAGAVGAVAWDAGNGEWRCKVDKIESPVAVFTEENIEGEFNYAHSDVDTRYNDIIMSYKNLEFDYREDRVRVWDQADIDLNGRKTTTMVALGCNNRQEAYRRAMLRLRSSLKEFRVVNFTTNRQGRFFEPLSTVLVADKSLGYLAPTGSTALANTDPRNDTTGRIVAIDGARTTLTVRDPLRLEPGASYTLKITIPNPNYTPTPTTAPANADWNLPTIVQTYTVATGSPRGDVTTVTLTTALAASVPINAVVALDAPGLPSLPKTYRLIDIDVGDDGERVLLTAIEVDTGKQAAADAVASSAIEAQIPDTSAPKPLTPTAGIFHLRSFVSDFATNRVLEVDWERPNSKFVGGFRVDYRFNDGPKQSLAMTQDTRIEIQNPEFGKWDFEIYTIDRRGQESVPLTATYTVTEYAQSSPVGYLTNESHTLPAATDGTVSSYTGAGGTFKVSLGDLDVTSACTFAITSNPQALTASIANATGIYAVTGGFDPGEDSATLTLVATHTASGSTVTKTFSLGKSKGGVNAKLVVLSSDRQTISYDSAGAASPSTQTTSFTATKQNTSVAVVWTVTDISGAARTPLATYLTATGDTATMTEAQFDAARNGTTGVIVTATVTDGVTLSDRISVVRVVNGSNGAAGLNNATVIVYQRAASAPALPNATTTYTFIGGGLSGLTNGWTTTIPTANGNPLYATVATASSATATDTIAAGEWSSAVILAQDGSTGATGLSSASVFLYKRATSTPAVPSVTSTYTFASGVLTGHNNGWTQAVPSGADPLYVTTASAAATTATDTIATGEWASPTVLAANGAVVALTSDAQGFKFVDNVATPGSQTITLTAIKQNTSETINWSTTPSVTLGGTGDVRTLVIADFAANRQVVVTATGSITGIKDTMTIVRLDQSTAEAGADVTSTHASVGDGNRVRYSLFEKGTLGYGILLFSPGTPLSLGQGTNNGKTYISAEYAFSAANQVIQIGQNRFDSKMLVPVTPSERVSVSCAIQIFGLTTGGTWELHWRYLDTAMNEVAGGTNVATGSAAVAYGTRYAGFFTVPANARYGWIELQYENHSSAASNVTIAMIEPMVTTAGAAQTVHPAFTPGPDNEQGADVSYTIVDPPQSTVFKYDASGTAETGEFNRDLTFKLLGQSGTVASGIAWRAKVISGGFNGNTVATGEFALTTTGTLTQSITSLLNVTNVVEIYADYAGKRMVYVLELTKKIALPSGGVLASKNSGFTSFSTTSYADITGAITAVQPAGVTSANIQITLDAMPASGATGSWTVSMKLQYDVGGTWTDIGSVTSANSDWNSVDVSGTQATIIVNIPHTGLTGGTSYNRRVQAKLTSGTRSHTVTGSVIITT